MGTGQADGLSDPGSLLGSGPTDGTASRKRLQRPSPQHGGFSALSPRAVHLPADCRLHRFTTRGHLKTVSEEVGERKTVHHVEAKAQPLSVPCETTGSLRAFSHAASKNVDLTSVHLARPIQTIGTAVMMSALRMIKSPIFVKYNNHVSDNAIASCRNQLPGARTSAAGRRVDWCHG